MHDAVARWPGHIAAGSTNAALVQYVDVLPTLIAAAGGDLLAIDPGCPDAVGRTPIDGADSSTSCWARAPACARRSSPSTSRAVCDGRWKLVSNIHPNEVFRNAISDGGILTS